MADKVFRLLLARESTSPIPPVDGAGLVGLWPESLRASLALEAERIGAALLELRRTWQPAADNEAWEGVAPSLVMGWLLGHVGASQFLQAIDLTAAATDLEGSELEEAVALSFLRVSANDGVAHLLGGPYVGGLSVRKTLDQGAVLSTLGSADAEGELLMYTTAPLRLLNAYREENRRAFYPGTFRLALPVLSASTLQAMDTPLGRVSREMGAAWSQLLAAAEPLLAEGGEPGQWLRFFSFCGGQLSRLWLERGLLPAVVPFEPQRRAGWFWRKEQQEQQAPCGLCFWRDVEEMWRLGQNLASKFPPF